MIPAGGERLTGIHGREDAFVRNKETSQFFDKNKLHTLDHHGDFFKVAGPLNIAAPQGRSIISRPARRMTAKLAAPRRCHFTHQDSLARGAGHFIRDVKSQLAAYQRSPGPTAYFHQGVSVIVRDDAEDASGSTRPPRRWSPSRMR